MECPYARKTLSLNVAGIKTPTRRLAFFNWLLNSTTADILLQETHLFPAGEGERTKDWGGYADSILPLKHRCAWWSHSDTAYSGGTAILIRPSSRKRFYL